MLPAIVPLKIKEAKATIAAKITRVTTICFFVRFFLGSAIREYLVSQYK